MILSTIMTVATFDPAIETALFLFLCVLAVLFLVDGANHFDEYNKVGKALVFLALLPLIGLFIYGAQYGVWADEINNSTDMYMQPLIGSDMENSFLITTCLLTLFAKSFPKTEK